MTLASKITLTRILMIPFIIYLMFTSVIPYSRLVVIPLFIIASLTDAVDGYFARRYQQVTRLGQFLDPLADKLLIVSILVSMIELGMVKALPVIIIIAREFAVTGLRLIAAREGLVIDASRWGKYKTVLQVITVSAIFIEDRVLGTISYSTYLLWLAVVVTIVSGFDYFARNGKVWTYETEQRV